MPGARDPGINNSKSLCAGNSKSDGEVCTSFPRLWLTKYHKQGDLDNRNFLPPRSAGWNTEIEVPAGSVLPEGWERFTGGTSGKGTPLPMQEAQETQVQSPGREDPWRMAQQVTPVLSGEPHGQRSLEGFSPRGRNESDTTK